MSTAHKIPYAVTTAAETGLDYMTLEISYEGTWVNLNDGIRYKINADQTRDNTTKSWRKVTAQSPVLGGDYLIHAVPDMVIETVSIWVHGSDQTDLADNFWLLEELFEQFDYRLRWTFNEYREYWRCQLAEGASSRGHVWSHSVMAMQSFQVPRYPEVTRERIG